MRKLLLSLVSMALAAQAGFPVLRGPYLGQKLPGPVPELFAPGIVAAGLPTRDLAMAADGSELYFTVMLPGFQLSAICSTHIVNGAWTPPEVAPFARDGRWRTLEPCLSPDGARFFFVTDRPADPKDTKPGPFGIWMMDRKGKGWSEPIRLPACVNGDGDSFFPSLTWDGTLYFLREKGRERTILRAHLAAGTYKESEILPPPLNQAPVQANPFVDPRERFLIIPMAGRPDSLGGADYYISFRKDDGGWTEPKNLGVPISSEDGQEYSASLSPDGRFLFFMSGRIPSGIKPGTLTFEALQAFRTRPCNGNPSIWWVDASFLAGLRVKALGQ
jgi:hypothetical protein